MSAKTRDYDTFQGRPVQRIVYDPSWDWRCNLCGWVGLGLSSEAGAKSEAERHVCPPEWLDAP